MEQTHNDFQFYKDSLRKAENDIRIDHETEKALKDIVGNAFEMHRKRIWEHFGFDIVKDKSYKKNTITQLKSLCKKFKIKGYSNKTRDELIQILSEYNPSSLPVPEYMDLIRFNADLIITCKGKLIAIEECKGHYLDSCFLERALTGFCKTTLAFQKKDKPIPKFILHSFTKYNIINQKMEEDLETRKPKIADEIRQNLKYTTLMDCDRLKKDKWFSKDLYDCYSINANDELILKDIEFIRSLIPVSE